MSNLNNLLADVRACTICAEHLPLGPRPVLKAAQSSRILIVGQAPGTAVHKSGIPWDDPSGKRLRQWMNIKPEVFYDESKVAIMPMGFCYPGKGKSGDLPPRPECAPQWHNKLLEQLPNIELTLLIGQYAQGHYLGSKKKKTLTDTVKAYDEYLPHFIAMPHPSPRNIFWLKRNAWFEQDVVPYLQQRVQEILAKK